MILYLLFNAHANIAASTTAAATTATTAVSIGVQSPRAGTVIMLITTTVLTFQCISIAGLRGDGDTGRYRTKIRRNREDGSAREATTLITTASTAKIRAVRTRRRRTTVHGNRWQWNIMMMIEFPLLEIKSAHIHGCAQGPGQLQFTIDAFPIRTEF